MTYFSLRKRPAEPEPEPDEVEEAAEEISKDEETEGEQPVGKSTGPLLTGLLGPGRWLAAHFGTGTAWGVHLVAAWAIFFYGGLAAFSIVTSWLLAVLLFVPKEYLDRLTARIQGSPEGNAETEDEPAGEEPPQPDPQDVIDLVRDLIGGDRGILLTTLRHPLRAADTRAVREMLAAAGIRVREGVRTGGGNGPGVHRDDLPPLPSPLGRLPEGGVAAGERANTNANNALRVQSREGMTIINDPADRHRTHTLKKP